MCRSAISKSGIKQKKTGAWLRCQAPDDYKESQMKNGVEYKDVIREIIEIFAKYEATVLDVQRIVEGLNAEMIVSPVENQTD